MQIFRIQLYASIVPVPVVIFIAKELLLKLPWELFCEMKIQVVPVPACILMCSQHLATGTL
jgi:hypothetical protein